MRIAEFRAPLSHLGSSRPAWLQRLPSQKNKKNEKQKNLTGARVMAQQLRALTAPAEAWGLVPSMHMVAYSSLQLQFLGDSMLSSVTVYGTHTYTLAHAHTYKIKLLKQNKAKCKLNQTKIN